MQQHDPNATNTTEQHLYEVNTHSGVMLY